MREVRNNAVRRRTSNALQILSALTLLAATQTVFAQVTSSEAVILFRNIRLANANGVLISTSALITSGKITQVGRGIAAPPGTVVIDGGGNVLAIGADGAIKLSSAPATATDPLTNNSSPGTAPARAAGLALSSTLRQYRSSSVNFSESVYLPRVTRGDLSSLSAKQTQQGPNDNLASKVVDPSAPLTTILFQDKYVPSLWGIDDDENELMMQVAVPWKLGKTLSIFRVILPFLTNTPPPGNNGVSDVGVRNITVLPERWGKFLIGPVASFGNNKGADVDTFSIGPAVGAIFKHGKWIYGIFNQNLFSFGGDIATSQFQPILAYALNPKVSFAFGEAQYVVDWKRGGRLTSAPLSGQVNYIHTFGEQPVRFFFNAQYSMVNDFGARKWIVSPGFALILK